MTNLLTTLSNGVVEVILDDDNDQPMDEDAEGENTKPTKLIDCEDTSIQTFPAHTA